MLPKLFNVATAEKYSHQDEMKKILPEWRKICCPTVIVTGAKDWVADTSNFRCADTLLKNCCNKKLIWLPDAGHFITYDKKEFVKNLLLEE
jgi:pimeloyl-ACP methyl ester carboxylesterase